MTFTNSELLLTDARLAAIAAERANAGITTPIETVIAEVVARATEYTKSYQVADAILKPLVRAIALAELLAPLGAATEAQLKAAKDALTELRDIQSGKGNYPVATTPPAGTTEADARAAWGSKPDIFSS